LFEVGIDLPLNCSNNHIPKSIEASSSVISKKVLNERISELKGFNTFFFEDALMRPSFERIEELMLSSLYRISFLSIGL